MFAHWIAGMIYVFYFASFVLLLREVVRPGLLWFLRNLNDPDFNPIHDMLQQPVHRHIRRFICSSVLFAAIIMLLVFLPLQLITKTTSTILPYQITLNVETPISELSLELILLQVVLPALLEQSHTRAVMKQLTLCWCRIVGRLLGLTEYLLPAEVVEADARAAAASNGTGSEETNEQQASQSNNENTDSRPETNNDIKSDTGVNAATNNTENDRPSSSNGDNSGENHVNIVINNAPPPPQPPPPAPPIVMNNLAEEHNAQINLLVGGVTGFQPYARPTQLAARICMMLCLMALSMMVSSFLFFSLPVVLGRASLHWITGHKATHELYTLACGLYLCWVGLRLGLLLSEYLPKGWSYLWSSIRFWIIVMLKCVVVGVPFFLVIPLFMGILFQVLVATPIRVPLNQSPLLFLTQDWALGILHCKICCAAAMMGPDWWLKAGCEKVYQDGIRNIDVGYIYKNLIVPIMCTLGLVLAIPYLTAYSIMPLYGYSLEDEVLFHRHSYPCILILTGAAAFVIWHAKQLNRLLIHIRNDKYLVGQRLVNYKSAKSGGNSPTHGPTPSASAGSLPELDRSGAGFEAENAVIVD